MKKEFEDILTRLEQMNVDFEKAKCEIHPLWHNNNLHELEIRADEEGILALLKIISFDYREDSNSEDLLPDWIYEKFPISVIPFSEEHEPATQPDNPLLEKIWLVGCAIIALFLTAAVIVGTGTIFNWIF